MTRLDAGAASSESIRLLKAIDVHGHYGTCERPELPLNTELMSASASTEPGFSQCRFSPQLLGLKFAAGSIPTPHGRVHVRIEDTNTGVKADLQLPPGVVARDDLGNQFGPGHHRVDLRSDR